MFKKFSILVILSLAVACATGPSAQRTLDTAEDALTTACEQAFLPTTLAKFGQDKIMDIAKACSAGGSASLAAQSAYQMSQTVPDDQKAGWINQMQLSVDIMRQVTAQVLVFIGGK